jgi:hypothetical protein
MEMVEVVHPTLEDYAGRVKALASKYEASSWMSLRPEVMDEDDRFEFSFIQMAVGDLLVHREYFESPPGEQGLDIDASVEPGQTPGSTVWWGDSVERHRVCRIN